MMRNFTYAENADTHYMYNHANSNGIAALRMYHGEFSDRRIPDHRSFQRLHRQLRETRSFYVTKHNGGRQRAVRSPSPEEIILNVVSD
ncbi:hypothetical protein TNCV_887161 [Trichonephila clavipes]|uniref:DUF4817 domain-containing protein n=1 Tax=Trichonephila clavipes TaxID=2585209 RepID=A0A8X6V081_TRICX|nr:hypothetical protein TNCV_887161 [Trichonephila clavipes]